MGVQLFTNNASSTLASGILAGTTSIPLSPGTGALFPAISGSDYFYVTFDDGAGTREIVKVTARSTDTLTVTRAQEGTTASAFDAGDVVELRPTAAGLTNFTQKTGSSLTIDDSNLTIQDNSDQTKQVRFQASGITTGTTRTLTVPDADTTLVGTDATQTLTNKTLTNPTVTNYTETLYSANTSTAITLDLANGTVQKLTLTGNCTITFPANTAGKSLLIILLQDGTGSRTVTWDSDVKWPSSTAPTITSTASKADIYSFVCDGTYWYGVQGGTNYL